jgi:hypothetical protein
LKKSVVKPIYKHGEIEEAINYRLITLVPASSQVPEKVIANPLTFKRRTFETQVFLAGRI